MCLVLYSRLVSVSVCLFVCLFCLSVSVLRASAMLKHVIDIGWTSVRPSHAGIKTAEHIVMLSSPHDSPFILVLCVTRYSRNSDGVTPCGGAKYRWGIKICAIFYQ